MQQRVPARVVMQVLGHSQISLTLGTYSHVVPELAQEAADRMTAALWSPLATTLAPSILNDEDRSPKGAGQHGGAGGARTHDRRIMSPLL